MKSFLRVVIVGVCLVTMGMIMDARAEAPFTDVPEGSEYAQALSYLKARGVIQGYPDGTFKPDQVVNRAEALKMLIVGHKKTIPNTLSREGFPDIPKGAWYEDYIYYAKSKGYIGGYPDGTFKPEQTVNKAEALKMLFTVAGLHPQASDSGGEVDESQWYAGFLLKAYDENLIETTRPSSYALTSEVTRGELATMLYRFLFIKESGASTFNDSTEGRISYYADEFNGRSTASGEIYDGSIFTAAHPSLPFGSFVQVVDAITNNSVLVRVNDRGPFGGGVLDLSKRAFQEFYTTAKGVFSGKVYPTNFSWDYAMKKYYSSSFFPGVKLSRKVPSMFQKGEMFLVQGTLSTTPPLMVDFKYPSGKEQNYEYDPNGSNVSIPLYFPEEGKYSLAIYPRGQEAPAVDLYVTDGLFGRAIRTIDPSGFAVSSELKDGGIVLQWKPDVQTNMFKLVAHKDGWRKVFYANNIEDVLLDSTLLEGQDPAGMTVDIYGGFSATGFLHDVSTNWAHVGSVTLKDNSVSATSNSNSNTSANTSTNTNTNTNTNTTSTSTVDTSLSDRENMLGWVNNDRKLHSAPALELDNTLNAIAQHKAEDMANNDYFDHKNLQGQYVNDWKGEFGFAPYVTENIALTSQGLAHGYTLFQGSERHFANIIDPTFEILGIGLAQKGDKLYIVQEFSTKPLGTSSISAQRDELLKNATHSGLNVIQHSGLTAVSQDWATYLADTDTISLYIGNQRVLDIAQQKTGISNLDSFVSQADNLETITDHLRSKLSTLSGDVQLGLGLNQSSNGNIYATLIIRK